MFSKVGACAGQFLTAASHDNIASTSLPKRLS